MVNKGSGVWMVALAYTVAFEGVEARLVEVQCAVAPGIPAFAVVGLPDKAVSEARERIRAAFGAMSVAMPNKRVTVNLSPADLPKEGSHFDLPIALAVLAVLEVLPPDELEGVVSLGELALDGRLVPVAGALPAAMAAAEEGRVLICPPACGAEAAWVGAVPVFCEIEGERFALDPADVERRITPRTRAMVLVHLWGLPAQVNALLNTNATSTVTYVDNTNTPSATSTLTLSVNDNGNTGSGGATSAIPLVSKGRSEGADSPRTGSANRSSDGRSLRLPSSATSTNPRLARWRIAEPTCVRTFFCAIRSS